MACICSQCGKNLSNNEVGLTRKFINRKPKDFFCIDCLSKKLSVSRELLEEKIIYFKGTGCSLFN